MNWTGSGLPENTLQVWKAAVDWASNAVARGEARERHLRPRRTTRTCATTPGACISQPGTTSKVDALGDRLMYRLSLPELRDRPGDGREPHSRHDGADHAGIRWYQLRKTTGSWGIHSRARTHPTASTGSWAALPWIARATSRSATRSRRPSTFPGIRYAGRLATDPAGPARAG